MFLNQISLYTLKNKSCACSQKSTKGNATKTTENQYSQYKDNQNDIFGEILCFRVSLIKFLLPGVDSIFDFSVSLKKKGRF